MKNLFSYGDTFMQQSDWRDISLLKLCLFSLGILFGVKLPHKAKKPATAVSLTVFIATYVPLMFKLLNIFTKKEVSE
ncbi:hypothetical protein [Sinanaerobacter sp. ZZT-01]|uniref:hypothetical protein n=1 Tax=Sinanaerobacter sp. ZZT-01 TaxID=3111540 RepID=UPI002D7732FE|nr:hypothetical protein [Sinanaerobacter sp. ZZT-01]WRR92298.1 hypothetical protein U5921_09495 [Sinanaerobacter sp. ZZT-01]